MRSTKLGAIACLFAGVVACSSNRAQTHAAAVEESSRTVVVRNDNWLDVAVYVVRGGMRHRIGTVSGLSTANLRLGQGWMVDGTMRLQVDPIGSKATYTTEAVFVAPGQRAELRVQNRLSHTTFSVWNR